MGERKHKLDESVFDVITEQSAYWIGFMMADGCVSQPISKISRKLLTPKLQLGLSVVDIDHVQKFKRFLGSSHKITVSTHQSKGVSHLNALLPITSRRLVAALAKYGVVPRKSHTAKVIGLEFDRHFWRGAIDGDGSIWLGTRRIKGGEYQFPCLNFCGSGEMVNQFINFVRHHVPNCRAQACFNGSIYYVNLSFRIATQIIDILYRDCKIALDRKLSLAACILQSRASDLLPREKVVPISQIRRDSRLCIICGGIPEPNKLRCADHLKIAVTYSQKNQAKRLKKATYKVVEEKKCPGCETVKSRACFSKDARTTDGLVCRCKLCVASSRSKTVRVDRALWG